MYKSVNLHKSFTSNNCIRSSRYEDGAIDADGMPGLGGQKGSWKWKVFVICQTSSLSSKSVPFFITLKLYFHQTDNSIPQFDDRKYKFWYILMSVLADKPCYWQVKTIFVETRNSISSVAWQSSETSDIDHHILTWSAGFRTLRRFVIQNRWVRLVQSAARIAFSNTSLTPKNVRTLVSKYGIPISLAAARPKYNYYPQ